ncbi:hypothetical protein CVD28_10560 [Bacillus sp. M6-12]|uniref:CotY/CotZ family spore coat protein n=1 Tax=Bacillus sp. M6-12 TaxID=2054166 RepID=UPI000C77BE4E|nr:CotY/CotZ family spore coat protein [Bacillus sp. M6-12]PLS17664.1 hypothetical protein CVD28_10560 [Bacillus sp. M6-12]
MSEVFYEDKEHEHNKHELGGILRQLAEIAKIQEELKEEKHGSVDNCIKALTQPVYQERRSKSVPLIFTTKANTLLFAFGRRHIKHSNGEDEFKSFATPFFVINKVNEKEGIIRLELLRPVKVEEGSSTTIRDFNDDECCIEIKSVVRTLAKNELILLKTNKFIHVDGNCLCAFQCFDPDLVAEKK